MSEAGHAGDDGGEPVLLKGLFNLGVKLGELVVEVEDVVSRRGTTLAATCCPTTTVCCAVAASMARAVRSRAL